MKKVLFRTLMSTLFATLFAVIIYHSLSKYIHKEAILIIGVLALMAAIPVIIGYLLAHVSLRSSNPLLIVAKFLFFSLNGLLIAGGTILTIAVSLEEIAAYISIPFLLAGSYTYYETIKLIRQPQNPNVQTLSGQDVLDDFFIDID